jgi:hypothetical protein
VALIGNYSVLSKSPGRDIGGGAIGLGHNRGDRNKASHHRARFTGSGWDPLSGVPDGYRPPYVWVLPLNAGGMASRNIITGTGSITATGAMGKNAVAALEGSGDLTATGALIVSAVAALTGSGSATGSIVAILNAVASISGSGSVTATIDALAWATAGLTGSGTLAATRYATGNMTADIQPFTELSPEALATSVWNAVAASNNAVGTMGEKLNDAGSGSNPWTEVIEGSYTAAELLRVMAAALAGELSGAGTTTITIKGVDGTTDRITATVTSAGNRSAVTLDGA